MRVKRHLPFQIIIVVSLIVCVLCTSACSVGLQGGNGIDVVGNSTDNSVIFSLDGTVVRGVLTDGGNATGAGGRLSMLGAGNVTVSASGSMITISCEGGEGGGGNATYALDSDKLDGQHGSYYLATDGNATYSLDSDKVDGSHASAFLAVAGTAADSDKVDGSHASAFLAVAGTAADSDKLDGSHASAFLAVAGTAADSDKLDGQEGSYYLQASGAAKVASGNYTGDGTENRPIAHGLGGVPKLVDIVGASGGYYWWKIYGGYGYLFYMTGTGLGRLGITAPTDTYFYVGSPDGSVYNRANMDTRVYYWVAWY